MKKSIHNWTLRVLTGVVCSLMTMGSMFAVPAYRGWQTKTQPDGTTIEIQQVGDEFYHYTVNKEGKQVRLNEAGFYEVVGEMPTKEEIRIRRAQSPLNNSEPRRGIGQPNLAPRGMVILVNYADLAINEQYTREMYDEWCNSTNCTINVYDEVQYGSAAQYFADQSNGAYRPIFDVVGPVTLSRDYAYYGENLENGGDRYPGDLIVEACLLADSLYDVDFSQYDLDNDQKVDFVFVIYAGKGEANGGDANTIWPHKYDVQSAIKTGFCTYTAEEATADGVYFSSYACSAELDGQGEFSGIGTLCHEFSHVLGLPDYYDTKYGPNYKMDLTPSQWDLMDAGAYNGGSHCPPNYNPWSKYFLGWVDAVHPGKDPTVLTFHPNGTAEYNICQVNISGQAEPAARSGVNYYIECRRKEGWDSFIPAEGMVIWKCNYNEINWLMNTVNNEENNLRLTIICSSGEKVGKNNAEGNVFPNGDITSWHGLPCVSLNDITWDGSIATCNYAYDESEIPAPVWTDWAYYDDGINTKWLGKDDGGTFYWAVMFPGFSLAGDTVRQIEIYEDTVHITKPIDFCILSGGDTPFPYGNIHTEEIEPAGVNGFHKVTLKEPVPFDRTHNLWIMLWSPENPYPAALCDDTGDRNGRWYSGDAFNWRELNTGDVSYTYMVRIYVGDKEEELGIEPVQSDPQPGCKIMRDGQLFIYREGKIYTVLGNLID